MQLLLAEHTRLLNMKRKALCKQHRIEMDFEWIAIAEWLAWIVFCWFKIRHQIWCTCIIMVKYFCSTQIRAFLLHIYSFMEIVNSVFVYSYQSTDYIEPNGLPMDCMQYACMDCGLLLFDCFWWNMKKSTKINIREWSEWVWERESEKCWFLFGGVLAQIVNMPVCR